MSLQSNPYNTSKLKERTFWELEEKVDKKKQKEVELQEIITPSFINEVIY